MDLTDIPLFSMLRGRMGYLSERQKIISENVANSDTPGFKPHDLKPFSFQAQLKAATGQTLALIQLAMEHMDPLGGEIDGSWGELPGLRGQPAEATDL